MKITKICIKNHSLFEDTELDCTDQTFFVGDNGTGKSLLLNEIYIWCTDHCTIKRSDFSELTNIRIEIQFDDEIKEFVKNIMFISMYEKYKNKNFDLKHIEEINNYTINISYLQNIVTDFNNLDQYLISNFPDPEPESNNIDSDPALNRTSINSRSEFEKLKKVALYIQNNYKKHISQKKMEDILRWCNNILTNDIKKCSIPILQNTHTILQNIVKNKLKIIKSFDNNTIMAENIFNLKNDNLTSYKYYFIKKHYKDIFSKEITVIKKNTEFKLVNMVDSMHYELSRGELSFVSILYQTIAYKNQICFYDEPFSFLSQRHIYSIIKILKISNNQMFIVTHSPDVLQNDNVNELSGIIYLSKKSKKTSLLYVNKIFNENKNSHQKSFLLDNKKLLFVSKVLFVEGMADYIFLKQFYNYLNICDKTNYDFPLILRMGTGDSNKYEITINLEINTKILLDDDINISKIKDFYLKMNLPFQDLTQHQQIKNNKYLAMYNSGDLETNIFKILYPEKYKENLRTNNNNFKHKLEYWLDVESSLITDLANQNDPNLTILIDELQNFILS